MGDAYAVCVLDEPQDDERGAAAAERRAVSPGVLGRARATLLVDDVRDAAPVEHPCAVEHVWWIVVRVSAEKEEKQETNYVWSL